MGIRGKKIGISLLLCLAILLPCLSWTAFAAEADAPANTVTIFTTNDIHGVVAASDSAIGMAQAAGIAASTENALLVDAGDATQGASFATITQGADVIRMMNAAGYDAMAAGNHEFDYGADQLLDNVRLAEFPVLSANVQRNGEPLLEKTAIVEVGGREIGFIGLTTQSTATSTNPAKLTGVEFTDEVEAAKAQINALKDEADAIVLICHMGDDAQAVSCTSEKLLQALQPDELAEVTAVVDGHSHTEEETAYGDKKIPIVQTGTLFAALGQITLTFGADNTVTAEGKVLDYAAASDYTLTAEGQQKKDEVAAKLAEIQKTQETVLGQKLCETETPLWGGNIYWDYAEPRIVETNFGDFITDAFAASAAAFAKNNKLEMPVIAVENGGGISATLPYGTVTRGDVLNAFNHGNMVDVLQITPEMLYTALEKGLVTTGQDKTGLLLRERVSGSFLQCSGFAYTYDPAAPAGEKVTGVQLADGTLLGRTDDKPLLLATNSYVGSTFEELGAEKLGELGGEDQIVEEYLLAQTKNGTKPLSVPTTANRIGIANDRSPETYTVTIPVVNIPVVTDQGQEVEKIPLGNRQAHLRIDDGEATAVTTDADGNLTLTLEKGPHTLYLEESDDSVPVYVNNYSGSGTVTKADGYYHLYFTAPADLPAPVESETKDPSSSETSKPKQPSSGTDTPAPEGAGTEPAEPGVLEPDTDDGMEPAGEEDLDIPATGDGTSLIWLGLLLPAGCAAAGASLLLRKHR